MQVKINVEMENSAFSESSSGTELARILRDLARKSEGQDWQIGDFITLRDINGNTVGKMKVTK